MTTKPVEVSVLPWAPPLVHGLVRDLRVRWALEEAGLPYREHVVAKGEQSSAAYHERQPFGQIPAYRSEDVSLFESGAIVHHIALQSPALMPDEPEARAQVTAWMFGALNSIEPPAQMVQVVDFLYQGAKGPDVQGLREWIVGWTSTRLDDLAQVLQGKDYVLFDRFTAADLLLTTVLRMLRHTDYVSKRPVLVAYQTRNEERPAFRRALEAHLATFAKHAPPDQAPS